MLILILCLAENADSHPLFGRPSSVQRLKEVEGVSDVWVENFGGRMLRRIEEFCQKSGGNVPLDVADTAGLVVEPREITVKVMHGLCVCQCVCVC